MTTQELPPQGERMEIERGEFSLKQFVSDDAPAIFALIEYDRTHLSQDHNGDSDDTAEKYQTVDDVKESIMHPKDPRKLRFGIWDGATVVGSNNLTPLDKEGRAVESGSWIGKEHTGNNYAARARELLIELAFERLGYKLIVSEIAVGNEASRKSVEKSGYAYKGIVQKPDKQRVLHDYWHYELSREDFESRQS